MAQQLTCTAPDRRYDREKTREPQTVLASDEYFVCLLGSPPAVILVTGGTGFVGRALIPFLLDRGDQVRLLTRRTGPRSPSGTGFQEVAGDLLDPPSLRAALTGVTTVVSLAAAHDATTEPPTVRRVNVDGIRNLAQLAAAHGVRRFIHCSTAAVYGDGASLGLRNESTPPAPQTIYQKTKLEGERALVSELLGTGVSWIIFRPPALYGPGREATVRFYGQILRRPMWIHTPSVVLETPTYVGDLIRAIGLAIDHPDVAGEILNIGGSVTLSYPELIGRIGARLGVHVRQVQLPFGVLHSCGRLATAAVRAVGRTAPPALDRLARPVINRSVDCARARRFLRFEPHTLDEGIDATIAAARRQGAL